MYTTVVSVTRVFLFVSVLHATQWCNWCWSIVLISLLQVFPSAKVKSALRTIYENNVQGFGGGQMGAINGCKPDGSADRTTVQSEEFWTGVSYALSANFLQEVIIKCLQFMHCEKSVIWFTWNKFSFSVLKDILHRLFPVRSGYCKVHVWKLVWIIYIISKSCSLNQKVW